MIITIVGASALEFWLSGVAIYPPNQFSLQNRKLVSLPEEYDIPYSQEIYQELSAKYHLSLPVRVIAEKDSGRITKPFLHACKRPKHLPKKSFIQIDKNVYICSPELCFVQLAGKIPLPKTIEVANNLCAIYSFDGNTFYGQTAREPLVTVCAINDYLQTAGKLSGIRKARQAIAYVVDRSYSPMESKLAALAVLPVSQGGYGLLKPALNLDIVLSEPAAEFLGRKACCCDLVWQNQKVVVEYDSNLSHLSPNQHAYDKRKANALRMSGYTVFSITSENMRNFKEIERTFLNLRKLLGLRTNGKVFENNQSKRRDAVHAIVFDSLSKYMK